MSMNREAFSTSTRTSRQGLSLSDGSSRFEKMRFCPTQLRATIGKSDGLSHCVEAYCFFVVIVAAAESAQTASEGVGGGGWRRGARRCGTGIVHL